MTTSTLQTTKNTVIERIQSLRTLMAHHVIYANSNVAGNAIDNVGSNDDGTNTNVINDGINDAINDGIDAIIIPTADPHLSEYLPEHWQLREWLSGFTGSAGTLVVTADYAGLWADSRYWVQAEQQLSGTGIELQKLQKGNTHVHWLSANMPAHACVAIDGNMLSVAGHDQLTKAFADKGIRLYCDVSMTKIWHALWCERPALPCAALFSHQPEFVSVSTANKLMQVREQMQAVNATHHLLSSLDDIAWLTNLRGADVEYNPVFLSHLLISADTAKLFVDVPDADKVSTEIAQQLANDGIQLANYQQVSTALAEIDTVNDHVGSVGHSRLLIDANKVAIATLAELPDSVELIKQIAPSTLLKSRKTPQDIDHIKEAMRQDGVALCEFFAELEQRLTKGERLSELDVDSMLIEKRSKQPHYVSPSFATIAGFNANGALPHYRATEDSFSYLDGDGLLLIDSGAQYHNGTTDITRVVPIGNPSNISAAHQRDFTAVLKAHIALATTCFPEGISSPLIDAICRAPLWEMQMDYGHGTGHGVGYFLNVHEPPQAIGYSAPVTNERAMRQGMITSNEPGLYREGQWGIRIENLVANVAVPDPAETQFGEYLCFETLTLCPIDTRLVNKSMLNQTEIDWLNQYHARVRTELQDRLTDNYANNRANNSTNNAPNQALAWLIERTQSI